MNDRKTTLIATIAELEAQRTALMAELVALNLHREPDDRLLTVEEAASILSVSVDWLYRHADEFRFTVRPGPGQVRFSAMGVQEYLKRARDA